MDQRRGRSHMRCTGAPSVISVLSLDPTCGGGTLLKCGGSLAWGAPKHRECSSVDQSRAAREATLRGTKFEDPLPALLERSSWAADHVYVQLFFLGSFGYGCEAVSISYPKPKRERGRVRPQPSSSESRGLLVGGRCRASWRSCRRCRRPRGASAGLRTARNSVPDAILENWGKKGPGQNNTEEGENEKTRGH